MEYIGEKDDGRNTLITDPTTNFYEYSEDQQLVLEDEKAIAEAFAEEADTELRRVWPSGKTAKKAIISRTDAGTLVVDFPSTGINADAVIAGSFSIAWFSVIVPSTLTGGWLMFPFLLPFWLAGGVVAKAALVEPFTSSQLSIGEFAWRLSSQFQKRVREISGSTDSIHHARVLDQTRIINYKPHYKYELRLYTDSGVVSVLTSSDPDEPKYLAELVNDQLSKLRKSKKNDTVAFDDNSLERRFGSF